jgi:hypothetical protein
MARLMWRDAAMGVMHMQSCNCNAMMHLHGFRGFSCHLWLEGIFLQGKTAACGVALTDF